MPASSSRRPQPKYRHFKPRNLAVVRIRGRDFYLGAYDSTESWQKYYQLLAQERSTAGGVTALLLQQTDQPSSASAR